MNVKQKAQKIVVRELASVKKDFAETAASGSKWWASLSPAQQMAYLKKHPSSDYADEKGPWGEADKEAQAHIKRMYGKVQPHQSHAKYLLKASKLAGAPLTKEGDPRPKAMMNLLQHLRKGLPKVKAPRASSAHPEHIHDAMHKWANHVIKKHAVSDMRNDGILGADVGLHDAAMVAHAGHLLRKGASARKVANFLYRKRVDSETVATGASRRASTYLNKDIGD